MDQSLLKSILTSAHCHSHPLKYDAVPTNPKSSQKFPHFPPSDRSGHCGDRRTVTSPTFSPVPALHCLGLSLDGVAQCLLLLSRWTLGYASLPSNLIESMQSICNTRHPLCDVALHLVPAQYCVYSNHKSHNVLLCNKSETQSPSFYCST